MNEVRGRQQMCLDLRAAGVSPQWTITHRCWLGFHGDSKAHWYSGQSVSPSHYQHLHTHQWRWTMQMSAKFWEVFIGFVFLFATTTRHKIWVASATEMLILGRQYIKIWPHFYMRSWTDFCTLFFLVVLLFLSVFLWDHCGNHIHMACQVFHISED